MSDQHQADRDRASARAGLKDLGRGRGRLDQGTCRGCGAGVLWTVTAAGKKMPLDPKPVSGRETFATAGEPGLSAWVKGPLNPAWIEALMGFPPDWTRIDTQLDLFG